MYEGLCKYPNSRKRRQLEEQREDIEKKRKLLNRSKPTNDKTKQNRPKATEYVLCLGDDRSMFA